MALRLRLRLAYYKVRSNQIHVPLDSLQIRSCATDPELLPLQKTRANFSPRRTLLPTAGPGIKIHTPSLAYNRNSRNLSSSPPSPYIHIPTREEREKLFPQSLETKIPRKSLATPVLPRQRDAFPNPPSLDSPIWDNRKTELTSSIVKGRAADGLLSLHQQQ